MPRFYFKIREGDYFARDDEGLQFISLEAAEREVATNAAEIAHYRLPKGDARHVTIELRNEHHQRLLTVTAFMEIHREALAI